MTDRYAVIGNPIGHSKSPMIHNAFAAQTGQDVEYAATEAPTDGFAAAVDAFRARGGHGLSITTQAMIGKPTVSPTASRA